MVYQGFCGGSNVTVSSIADCERTINFYLERSVSPGAKSPLVMYPMPGLRQFASVGQGPVRALGAAKGRALAVIGPQLYEIFSNQTLTPRGTVANDGLPATISWNVHGAQQVFITAGRVGYIFDLQANTLTQVVTNADVGIFINGYFAALDVTTSIFKWSNLEDGTTWDAGNEIQRQSGSDDWKAMATKNGEVWLIGSQTTDIYVGTGLLNAPFAPVPQGLIQMGTPATFGPAVLSELNSMAWLAGNEQGQGTVVATIGYGMQKISTPAVDKALQSYGDLSGALAYAYQVLGHNFILVNVPSGPGTWVYDVTTGLWTERLFWNRTQAQWNAHVGGCHCFAFNKHLIGDRSTGVIYEESPDVALEADGVGMRRTRVATHLSNEGKNVIYDRLRVDMEVGVGLPTGQGSDPQAMLRYSDDGGKTWSNELWTTAGKIGTYQTMVEWRRLGPARDKVFEFNVSDPVPWRINQAWLDLRLGRN